MPSPHHHRARKRPPAKRRRQPQQTTGSTFKIGRVHAYLRGNVWYIRYHERGRRIQRRIGPDKKVARRAAAEVCSQLETGMPSAFGFAQITLADLRDKWLAYHEDIKRSALATVSRYRAATAHLIRFGEQASLRHPSDFSSGQAEEFVRYLRRFRVSPNGHQNTRTWVMRDSGVKYVLQTSSNLFNYAKRQRHLPPYFENPFTSLEIGRFRIEDAKPTVVFTPEEERRLLENAGGWLFPILLTLLQTGMRPGELVHLLLSSDVDLAGGCIHIHNKPRLGWQVKTRCERSIPIRPELAAVLAPLIGNQASGTLFRQQRCSLGHCPPLAHLTRTQLEAELEQRARGLESTCDGLEPRVLRARAARTIWRDLGAVRYDRVRIAFTRLTKKIGRPDITALKTCRHHFATSLQDANVDPLIRNELLGHSPGGLGMTTRYTQTRPETKRRQLFDALEDQESTKVARQWLARRP